MSAVAAIRCRRYCSLSRREDGVDREQAREPGSTKQHRTRSTTAATRRPPGAQSPLRSDRANASTRQSRQGTRCLRSRTAAANAESIQTRTAQSGRAPGWRAPDATLMPRIPSQAGPATDPRGASVGGPAVHDSHLLMKSRLDSSRRLRQATLTPRTGLIPGNYTLSTTHTWRFVVTPDRRTVAAHTAFLGTAAQLAPDTYTCHGQGRFKIFSR